MLASNNVLSPANGEPIIVPSQDIVPGSLPRDRERINGQGRRYDTSADVEGSKRAYDGKVDLHARVCGSGAPEGSRRTGMASPPRRWCAATHRRSRHPVRDPAQGCPSAIDKLRRRREISKLINASFRRCGLKDTVVFRRPADAERLRLATRAGISIAVG